MEGLGDILIMNEFELIAAMLEDLNIRIEALEADEEGMRTDGTKFRQLHERLQVPLKAFNEWKAKQVVTKCNICNNLNCDIPNQKH